MRRTIIFWLTMVLGAGKLMAAATDEQPRRLDGPELTPLGAERGGNADGTIPAWSGGITEPPAGYKTGRQHIDPFADDPVLVRISADNMDKYADQLSEGQKALLSAYPQTWHMGVYPTQRSASYPDWVYAAVKANASTAQVVREGKGGVLGANVTIQPGLLAGNGLLVLEPVDQTHDPRKTWRYSRALRRVLRLPNVAHEFPAFNVDNLRTVDEFDMFNGSPERFEWRLRGKRELYIPYNAYRIYSSDAGYSDIIKTRHINPELARYELHRVWVVEGTLKPGMKHIYSRCVFYLDEDSWQIAVADNYDREGQLWRTSEAHALNYYQVPVQWRTLEVYYDLKAQRYLVSGLDNQRNPYRFTEQADPREFSPNALGLYIR
ncbi:MAG: DUF1329 domain-containing protein [Pseudomonadota bacterium]|nr:DUF1329 domain-containing protein [Pseudomonadota bacterium]